MILKWPDWWVETDLDTVVEKMTNGANLKQSDIEEDGTYPITRIETIALETIDLKRVKYVEADQPCIDKFGLQKGDILFSHINSDKHLGKTAIFDLNRTVIHGINLLLIRAKEGFNPYFLNYLFKYYRQKGGFIEVAQRAVNQSSINQKKLKSFPISLPPLAEQERIVEKLDALFANLEVIKTKLDRMPGLLKTFRQQVLTQAVTGKLTEEWREEKELTNRFISIPNDQMRDASFAVPENWCFLAFNRVAEVKSRLVDPKSYWDFPLIAPDNIEAETGKLISKPLVSDIKPKSAKHYFSNGNIVYSKIRPYLSKLVVVDFEGLCSADMYPITTDLEVKYLYFYMLSRDFLNYATTAGERSVLPKINQKGLSIIPVPVPPLEEQQEIVRRVEELFAIADTIEAQYQSLKAKVDKLPQAILAKAFHGELVPQNPADESVEVLLERIRTERDSKPTKGMRKLYKAGDSELSIAAEERGEYGER